MVNCWGVSFAPEQAIAKIETLPYKEAMAAVSQLPVAYRIWIDKSTGAFVDIAYDAD